MAQAAKRRTNLSVDGALLDETRSQSVNLSAPFERALREEVIRRRQEAWLEENKGAIEDANKLIETYGLWSDGLRLF